MGKSIHSWPSAPESGKDFRHGDPEAGQMRVAVEMPVDIEPLRLRIRLENCDEPARWFYSPNLFYPSFQKFVNLVSDIIAAV